MKQKKISGGLRKKGILKKDKKNLPLISIITVVLNNKKFLQQSINSVLNQSYKNYELIIIDGQSTDGTLNNIKIASLVEMSIGASIGAITFTGSVIAFLKLQGIMSGSPIIFKGQHFINLLIGISIGFLFFYITTNQNNHIFWTLIIISFSFKNFFAF